MRVLIVGGTGFLGYHSVLELLRRGSEVGVLARSAPKADLLPAEVGIYLGDVTTLEQPEMLTLLEGIDVIVFAAGVDDRRVPPAPAAPYFRAANVVPVVRMVQAGRKAGVARIVILGSYFSFFARLWPHLQLAERNPYIASRVAQADEALDAAEDELDVVTLELPFVFGSVPGRVPLWTPLVRYVTSSLPVLAPRGGTNMIAVDRVAEAVAGAAQGGIGGMRHLIGDENVSWQQLLVRLSTAAGRRRRVTTVPDGVVRLGLRGIHGYHRLLGREAGLAPSSVADLVTTETFFDPEPAQRALGFGGGGLDTAFGATARAAFSR